MVILRRTVRRVASKKTTRAPPSTIVPTAALRNASTRRFGDNKQHFRPPPTFLIFGSNTDIGKTVLTAALVRAAASPAGLSITEEEGAGWVPAESGEIGRSRNNNNIGTQLHHYIKPLQCGGSDEDFLRRHVPPDLLGSARTLFRWETPASPHLACRMEEHSVCDEQVLAALWGSIKGLTSMTGREQQTVELELEQDPDSTTTSTAPAPESPGGSIWIETAGGVLSPSSSSPLNRGRHHAANAAGWGWVTQADLYRPLCDMASVILIGDGRLGGISATLSSLEALTTRGYSADD
jgi:bifunctional dethiobiotin synthetase / adenosylmethionine---8-amino-7-oxononanoate aminotransferase